VKKVKLDIETIDAPKYDHPDIEMWRWFAYLGFLGTVIAADAALWFGFMKGREHTFLTWMERFM
jgi:hypothetical protein